MIYKSYLIEQNIEKLKEKLILFYGENLGLKNDFKKKILFKNKDAEIINFFQDEVIKNENLLFNEILNISLFDIPLDEAGDFLMYKYVSLCYLMQCIDMRVCGGWGGVFACSLI